MHNTRNLSKAERREAAREQVEKRASELKALLAREKVHDVVIALHIATEVLKKR